ncbi:MAG: hypothetical protein M0Q44_01315 [Methylobacter sp.]|jgi:hypothetical protein|nr:hypothetical protein [Methylobacter sp.]
MLEPVKIGLGWYMAGFYSYLVPTTKAMPEFLARGLPLSMVWATTGMIDKAGEMLAAWQRNDTDNAATHPAKLPVIIVAIARDAIPTGRDFTRQIADSMPAIIPGDVKERNFGLRTIAGDIRAQIVVFAAEEPTARSIAQQFCLYMDTISGRRFYADYTFAGVTEGWPVQVESVDAPFISTPTDVKNVVYMACDLTLKATIPLFDAPKVGDPNNDGQGIPETADPAGYQVVREVDTVKPTGTTTDSLGSIDKVIAP